MRRMLQPERPLKAGTGHCGHAAGNHQAVIGSQDMVGSRYRLDELGSLRTASSQRHEGEQNRGGSPMHVTKSNRHAVTFDNTKDWRS